MPDQDDYKDDSTIGDDAALWRRIREEQMVEDQNRGGKRPSSAAFQDSSDGTPMSVQIADIIKLNGGDARTALAPYPDLYLAELRAGDVRDKKLGVCRSPLQHDPAHAFVIGKKTGSVSRYLAKKARWVIGPSDA